MVFGVLRLYYVLVMDFTDVTGTQLGVVIQGTLEAGVSIMISSSPTLKPILDWAMGRLLSLKRRSQHTQIHAYPSIDKSGTLRTFGGGFVGGRSDGSGPSRKSGLRVQTTKEGGGENCLELNDFREHKHTVAITSAPDRLSPEFEEPDKSNERVDISDSETGILVTNRLTVIREQRR
ncbi:hypothetical protein SLS64_008356 [Diaporthe eres]|uniref:Integral membrane protein n=1 Tax=Diaporthe eres TaxID=83184 RepID=A0ABR1NNW3_DIAER